MSVERFDRREGPRRDDDLTVSEIRELRRIIESERNMRWLWATLRNFAVWIVAIVTGVTVGYQALVDVVRGLVK